MNKLKVLKALGLLLKSVNFGILASTGPGNHRSDGNQARHALKFNLDELMGASSDEILYFILSIFADRLVSRRCFC